MLSVSFITGTREEEIKLLRCLLSETPVRKSEFATDYDANLQIICLLDGLFSLFMESFEAWREKARGTMPFFSGGLRPRLSSVSRIFGGLLA